MIYPWGIIGHEKALLQLEKELAAENLAHAYLFYGPKDTGKFRVATVFASILLCSSNLCHQCRDCKFIQSGIHPDLIVMKDNGESIKIDDVRTLIQKTNLTSQGKRRIVLIENLERMPVEAQNSFLKTLEEPPGNTIFMMTSTQVKKIVPTILSRVRQQGFSLVSNEQIQKALVERFKEHTDFSDVLEMAQGRPGLAVRLLSKPEELSMYKSMFNQVDLFLKHNDLTTKFAVAEELDGDESKMRLFFDAFSFTLRKVAHDFLQGLPHPLKERYNLKQIVDLFESLLKTRYFIERNANKKLSLENFLLQTEH